MHVLWVMVWARDAFGASCVFIQQRAISTWGSPWTVALAGIGQSLLPTQLIISSGKAIRLYKYMICFGKSMLTIPITSWSLQCLAKMIMYLNSFYTVCHYIIFSISFVLHKFLPWFLKLARLQNHFLLPFMTLGNLRSKPSAFWFYH